ncbi:hypothetical protein J3A83DRAFT_4361906 [Scleroderma citrinum]
MLPANFQPATHSDELDSVLPIPEPGAGKVAIVATDFLDVTEDDSDMTESISVIKSIKNLMLNAKKYRSFTALFHLNSLQQFIELWEKYNHTISVSVEKGWYFTHKIHKLIGRHHAHPSLLNNECIAQAIHQYSTVLHDGEITPQLLIKQINTIILLSLGLDAAGQKISDGAACRWLGKLGYELKECKKGIYVDGHEQEDMVAYCKEFLDMFDKNERYIYEGLEPIEPQLKPGKQLHVPIMHDESIVCANELHYALMKKRQGCAVHILDFIVEQTGKLVLSESQVKENANLPAEYQLRGPLDAHEIIYPGKNHDGFLMNEKVVEQVKQAIPIFKQMYPNVVAEFMHNTFIPMDNPNPELCGRPQMMVFQTDLSPHHPDFEFCGQAANGRRAVRECQTCKLSCEAQAAAEGGDEPGESNFDIIQESLRTDCCMQKMLTNQQDFKEEKPLIQLVIEFHCELNPIEIRGLNACQAEFAVKESKLHRHCSPTLMMNVSILVNWELSNLLYL